MNVRALVLTALVLLIAVPASAELEGDRVRVTPMVGHVTFDATAPWNSIEPTVFYGGAIGVKVNRWFGINTYLGYAFANGNFGWEEDSAGDFVPVENNGTDVDVVAFGVDFSFHPLEGWIDPWVLVGWTMFNYDYDFDSAGFGDFLNDNDYTYDLGDLKAATGWQFGAGCALSFWETEHFSISAMADIRDMMVKSSKLEIVDASNQTVLESEWGHNFLINVGIEFSWGNYPAPTDEPNRRAHSGS